MKKFPLLCIFYSFTLLLISCETNEPDFDEIEGTYYGTLTSDVSGSQISTIAEDATAVIRKTGNQEVEVHCYSRDFDTIFRLNYFQHEDGFKVCLTGPDFEAMYNMPYAQPMGMGMGMQGNSGWSNHLSTMHREGDRHYGGFNTMDHSFEYHFINAVNLRFTGHRNNN